MALFRDVLSHQDEMKSFIAGTAWVVPSSIAAGTVVGGQDVNKIYCK